MSAQNPMTAILEDRDCGMTRPDLVKCASLPFTRAYMHLYFIINEKEEKERKSRITISIIKATTHQINVDESLLGKNVRLAALLVVYICFQIFLWNYIFFLSF